MQRRRGRHPDLARSGLPPQSRYLKMLLGIGHDLAVAGMVGSLDRNDALAELRMLLAEIFGKFGLRIGRADDQDFAGVADRVHPLREKLLVEPGMAAAD